MHIFWQCGGLTAGPNGLAGWFQKEAWEKVVARVESRFQALLQPRLASEGSPEPTGQQEAQAAIPVARNKLVEEPAAEIGEQAIDTTPSAQGGDVLLYVE